MVEEKNGLIDYKQHLKKRSRLCTVLKNGLDYVQY